MAAVPVPPLPLLASHAAVRALASRVVSTSAKRGRLGGDHPPQVAALRRGDWVKLICGASFEDAADVRNLSLVYTLAGADASVVGAVNEGIDVATSIVPAVQRPWVMISVNDDCRDLHFRKAGAVSYIRDPTITIGLLKRNDVDAIEIHTTGKETGMFNTLWNNLSESINYVKLVAVSLPDIGVSTFDFMNSIYEIMEPDLQGYNLWQLDGRPMSGDIGRGATRETISFAVHMASMSDRPPGFYQLAGGTNSYTIDSLKKAGLFQSMTFPGHLGMAASEMTGSQQALIGGIAYGGYARKIIGRTLRKIPTQFGCVPIEDHPDYLLEALQEALSLVGPVKGYPTL
ncbi:hypothetical protein PR202_gb24793 [Eleusine coracana subsp. coracana]|uniref:Iron-sulphur binding protein LdpA C-terminal domain-containing protein n=1 Tax=Eleusine coracana subsp. coracana TaxID=191504 RepID=A0AAV5FM05_ELECO|nr:hypothetical protein PR202_gb24793 [Eleusine coracana subsp. coracana]